MEITHWSLLLICLLNLKFTWFKGFALVFFYFCELSRRSCIFLEPKGDTERFMHGQNSGLTGMWHPRISQIRHLANLGTFNPTEGQIIGGTFEASNSVNNCLSRREHLTWCLNSPHPDAFIKRCNLRQKYFFWMFYNWTLRRQSLIQDWCYNWREIFVGVDLSCSSDK